MGTLLVLKEVEKENQVETSFDISSQKPAVILDFNQKFQKHLQSKKIYGRAQDGLEVLRVLMKDYEALMQDLAKQISPEQLAKVTELSAEDQIREDIRRIQDLINTLESRVNLKKGLTLQQAFEEIKAESSTELGVVAAYLEKNEYVLFQVMMKVIAWASVTPEKIALIELDIVIESLLQIGAFDTANALVFLGTPE